jgi:hypothetical protein
VTSVTALYVSVPESSKRVVVLIEGDMVVSLAIIVFLGISDSGNRSPAGIEVQRSQFSIVVAYKIGIRNPSHSS